MKINGIRGRLLFILSAAAFMVLSASIVALIALSGVRDELETVTRTELPAITAALGLARIGERLQYQGSVLVTSDEASARLNRQRLIEADMKNLVAEMEKLNATTSEGQVIIQSINDTALNLNADLLILNSSLTQRSEFALKLSKLRNDVLQAQEQIRQLLGPSILAVDSVLNRADSVRALTYQAAVKVLGPLLEAERLVNNAIENLLLAVTSDQPSTIDQSQKQFQRTNAKLDLLIGDLPAGLQKGLVFHLQILQQQTGNHGVFDIRRSELTALKTARDILNLINQESSLLKSQVDELVITTNQAIGTVTTRMGETIVKNTLWFVVGSVIVMLLMTLISWLWVVKPVGKNLIGVTEAMTLLAQGEREVQVPAIERKDEIGDLARAFTVFKNNMFRMDTLDRELSEQSNLLITTFENMNDGFTVFDADRKLIAWNPQFLKLYGLSTDFIAVGRSIEDIHYLLAKRGVQVLTNRGEAVPIDKLSNYREKETLRYELRLSNARSIELRSNPVPTGGFVTIHMDITERLATEAQLHQAQKMEMVGQLTGGIAHDFNNILAVILGNLHVLNRNLTDTPEMQERSAKALGAAERAERQVERLLAFSRRQKLDPEVIDVNTLVDDMMDLLGYSLGSDIKLVTDFAENLPMVRVDPGQLENALMNLAVNSRDAVKGRGQITFSTRSISETFVEISVADDGMGMPLEIAEHVFEPFYTTKPTGKGSGLGLSMVYGFINQSGGSVEINSQPGRGTTISLKLPVALSHSSAQTNVEHMPFGQGEKILVVDDDKEVLEITSEQVRELGYRVCSAANGEKALQILANDKDIRLMYTDVVMPEPWDGVALAQEVRNRYPDLGILFTSAETSNKVGVGERVLKKPVSKDHLARNLLDVLQR